MKINWFLMFGMLYIVGLYAAILFVFSRDGIHHSSLDVAQALVIGAAVPLLFGYYAGRWPG